MKSPSKALIAIVILIAVFSFIGVLYYTIPGYIHVFAIGNPTAVQPTGIAICFALFISSFLYGVAITPKKKQ